MATKEPDPEVPRGPRYWTISGGTEPAGVFVLDLAGLGKTLPVFSFREEAELFLAFGGLGAGWRALEVGTAEFISLFLGACADVESIVLDPLPAMFYDSTASLVGLSLDRFVDRFLGVLEPIPEPG